MAADGTAPGYIDTAMTTDVSRIADPVVRLVISNMVARQDFALQLQGQQMAEILTGQRSMKQSMDHMMDVMSQISSVHHFEERQHSLQPFPSVIHADSPSTWWGVERVERADITEKKRGRELLRCRAVRTSCARCAKNTS